MTVFSDTEVPMEIRGLDEPHLVRALVENMLDVVFVTDADFAWRYVTPSIEAMLGYSPDKMRGGPFIELIHPEDRARLETLMRDSASQGCVIGKIELRFKHAITGEYVWVESVGKSLENADGTFAGVVVAMRDISQRKRLEVKLASAEEAVYGMARHDALTHLLNRTGVRECLDADLARLRSGGPPVAVLLVGLDRFALVNDTVGQDAGDEVLRHIGERIEACVCGRDSVAHFGGDQFAVILRDAPAREAAETVAARILAGVSYPVRMMGKEMFVTASIGIALSPQDGSAADALITHADAAMHLAKDSGRNRFAFYTAGLDGEAAARFAIQGGLRTALGTEELSLVYQPQIHLTSGCLSGAEALLRWKSPVLGAVSPAQFIPIAEETGMIVDIDRWVLRSACRQAAAWQAAGVDVPRVAVNISGLSFRHAGLLFTIQSCLREAGLAPDRLEIELTEGVMMHDVAEVIETVGAIRKLGVQVALDDFGTGYSSLSYLKRFKLDVLKIDRSFVMGLPDNDEDAGIAKLITAAARALGMKTVAEGVETGAQARFLRGIGCDIGQGFLFSRGVPAAEMALLAARSWRSVTRNSASLTPSTRPVAAASIRP